MKRVTFVSWFLAVVCLLTAGIALFPSGTHASAIPAGVYDATYGTGCCTLSQICPGQAQGCPNSICVGIGQCDTGKRRDYPANHCTTGGTTPGDCGTPNPQYVCYETFDCGCVILICSNAIKVTKFYQTQTPGCGG